MLEVDPSVHKGLRFDNIAEEKMACKAPLGGRAMQQIKERPNSEGFVDDPDVPPLM